MLAFALVWNTSWWLLLPALALAAGYAYVLYPKVLSERVTQQRLLAALRFLSVLFLCILLINPQIKSVKTTTEKPLILFAQDNSASILLNKQKDYYRNDYPAAVQQLKDRIATRYELRNFHFGGKVKESDSLNFTETATDLSQVGQELSDRFINRNVGALIIASDGIYNQGSNPLYSIKALPFPIYTIALGDTTPQKDLLIASVEHNRLVNFKNDFRMNILLNAQDCSNSSTTLTVQHEGKVLFSQNISINSRSFRTEIPVDFTADKMGFNRYTIKVSTLNGEISTANNVQDVFIEVIDGKDQVLILANAPHPDLSAFKQSIEQNENYTANIQFIDKFDASSLTKYQVILFHQLPSDEHSITTLWNAVQQNNLSSAFVLGAQTNFNQLNQLKAGLSITSNKGNSNESQGIVNASFYNFTLSDAAKALLSKLPPLLAPYGNYSLNGNFSSLLYQKIGQAETSLPLISMGENSWGKTAFICGEGFWKWRLYNFQLQQDQAAVDECCNQLMQYLCTKEDRRKFRVRMNKNRLNESEPISFFGELYNDNNEPVNEPDVSLTIRNKAGKSYPFSFSRTATKAYQLDAGSLPQGEYRYEAKTQLGANKYTAEGSFVIQQLNLEALKTRADHQLLYTISNSTGGMMVLPANMQQIADALEKNELIQTVSYENKRLQDLINLRWLFALAMLLFSIEWFIRKRSGTY